MVDPRDLQLSSYDYRLPEERIAQAPVEPRHAARLLMVPPMNRAVTELRHRQVWDWQDELRPGDLLVVNDTRVLRARLRVRRCGGGLAELLVLEPRGEGRWLCLARPGKKLKPGDQVWLEALEQEPMALQVLTADSASGGRIIQFPAAFVDAAAIETLLERYGEVPLPPYITRHDESDQERYQTRYASRPGAVAAPTAGLHLSDELLKQIRGRGEPVVVGQLDPVGGQRAAHARVDSCRGSRSSEGWPGVAPGPAGVIRRSRTSERSGLRCVVPAARSSPPRWSSHGSAVSSTARQMIP